MLWIRSLFEIVRAESVMRLCSLQALQRLVKGQAPSRSPDAKPSVEDICHSIDLVCAFYPKQVLCLQRSAATALLLRRNGWRAEMIIGVQMLPFNSHAWVEVNGAVVNDKPYVTEMYHVLERC